MLKPGEYRIFADVLTAKIEREFAEKEKPPEIKFAIKNDMATWVFVFGPFRESVLTVTEGAFDHFDPGARSVDCPVTASNTRKKFPPMIFPTSSSG